MRNVAAQESFNDGNEGAAVVPGPGAESRLDSRENHSPSASNEGTIAIQACPIEGSSGEWTTWTLKHSLGQFTTGRLGPTVFKDSGWAQR